MFKYLSVNTKLMGNPYLAVAHSLNRLEVNDCSQCARHRQEPSLFCYSVSSQTWHTAVAMTTGHWQRRWHFTAHRFCIHQTCRASAVLHQHTRHMFMLLSSKILKGTGKENHSHFSQYSITHTLCQTRFLFLWTTKENIWKKYIKNVLMSHHALYSTSSKVTQ